MFLADTIICMTLALFYEARGESLEGKLAVASVVSYRAEKNKSSVCSELAKPNQFPWAKNRVVKKGNDYFIPKKTMDFISEEVGLLSLSQDIVSGYHKLVPSLISFDSRPHPEWNLGVPLQIGNHYFYKDRNVIKR